VALISWQHLVWGATREHHVPPIRWSSSSNLIPRLQDLRPRPWHLLHPTSFLLRLSSIWQRILTSNLELLHASPQRLPPISLLLVRQPSPPGSARRGCRRHAHELRLEKNKINRLGASLVPQVCRPPTLGGISARPRPPRQARLLYPILPPQLPLHRPPRRRPSRQDRYSTA
jgi:hypothetical protein